MLLLLSVPPCQNWTAMTLTSHTAGWDTLLYAEATREAPWPQFRTTGLRWQKTRAVGTSQTCRGNILVCRGCQLCFSSKSYLTVNNHSRLIVSRLVFNLKHRHNRLNELVCQKHVFSRAPGTRHQAPVTSRCTLLTVRITKSCLSISMVLAELSTGTSSVWGIS